MDGIWTYIIVMYLVWEIITEQQLKVVINRLWVNDNSKCANDILQRCKANSLKV